MSNINLPTVLRTAILPGDTVERLFIATQVGEIFYIEDDGVRTFLDIRSRIIELGTANGDFGSNSAHYTSLGTNINQTKMYLGVHGSMNVTDFNRGSVYEIVPQTLR